jgi:hypothetical protein
MPFLLKKKKKKRELSKTWNNGPVCPTLKLSKFHMQKGEEI